MRLMSVVEGLTVWVLRHASLSQGVEPLLATSVLIAPPSSLSSIHTRLHLTQAVIHLPHRR